MSTQPDRTVAIHALHDSRDWEVGVISLPMPADDVLAPAIDGCTVQAVPVGYWPRSEAYPGGPKRARRLLTFFMPEAQRADYQVSLTAPGEAVAEADSPWALELIKFNAQSLRRNETHWYYLHEDGELQLTHPKGRLNLRLGVENEYGLHWWQYINVSKLWSGPLCTAYRVGGHIAVGEDRPYTLEEANIANLDGTDRMIAASIYLLVFANGLVEITGHWINGRMYGGDGPCPGRPIVSFGAVELDLPDGGLPLTGEAMTFTAGAVTLDLSETREMVCPERPGRLYTAADGGLLWAPLHSTGVAYRFYSERRAESDVRRVYPKNFDESDGETVEGYETFITGSEKGFLPGVSVSATWTMRLGSGSTQIQRFLADPQWYADHCELAPLPYTITRGECSALASEIGVHSVRNQFSGSLSRGAFGRYYYNWNERLEMDCDGGAGRAAMRLAYWQTDPALYRLGLLNGYSIADAAMDHSRGIIHYHADHDTWQTFSMIYQRFTSMVTSYLETGDYYLLESAHTIAHTFITLHLLNWPRGGMGRDAEPLSGIMTLYDYTGDEQYYQFARDFAEHALATTTFDGSWLCGAGVGPMWGCNALPGSPWNGGHLSCGFTQFAMRFPQDVTAEMKGKMRAFLRTLYHLLDASHQGYHRASCGFLGMQHWYLACFLQDEELIRQTRAFIEKVLDQRRQDGDDAFIRGAHHAYNYMDNLIFFEATKDTLPALLGGGKIEAGVS